MRYWIYNIMIYLIYSRANVLGTYLPVSWPCTIVIKKKKNLPRNSPSKIDAHNDTIATSVLYYVISLLWPILMHYRIMLRRWTRTYKYDEAVGFAPNSYYIPIRSVCFSRVIVGKIISWLIKSRHFYLKKYKSHRTRSVTYKL